MELTENTFPNVTANKFQLFELPQATESVTPFELKVPQAAIDDLRQRLNLIRWPDREIVNDWSQGVPLPAAKALVDHWMNNYDWRKFESRTT